MKRDTILQIIAKEELDSQLDPQGWRKALINKKKKKEKKKIPQSIESGDIVCVTYAQTRCTYDSCIGYVLSIERKHLFHHASILLRNQISKTIVEIRVLIFSQLLERIDIFKRNGSKRRRNKHYCSRGTRVDVGNLEVKLR